MKPYTKLPWSGPITTLTREDSRFAIHACNAYPRLVAALRMYVKADDAEPAMKESSLDLANGECRALLRELGEAE